MGEVGYPRPLGMGHGHLPAPYQPEIQTADADSWLIAETMYKAHIPVESAPFHLRANVVCNTFCMLYFNKLWVSYDFWFWLQRIMYMLVYLLQC